MASSAISIGLVTFLFVRKYKLGDTSLLLFALSMASIQELFFALARNTLEMYLVGLMTAFSALSGPGYKAFISKQVPPGEVGESNLSQITE